MQISCTWVYKLIPISSGADKVCHLIAGFIIGVISFFVLPGAYALIPILAAGFGKELYDKYVRKTQFDFFDAFATILGGWGALMITGLITSLI